MSHPVGVGHHACQLCGNDVYKARARGWCKADVAAPTEQVVI